MKRSNSELKDTTKREVMRRHNRCFECGTTHGLTFSHILTKRWYDDYNDADNIVLDCIDCHHVWDNGTFEQKKKMKSLSRRMDIIRALRDKAIGEVRRRIQNRLDVLNYGMGGEI